MNYTSSVQNTSQAVYTPYIIKPASGNYVTYIDLVKFGSVTDFGYLQGYTSFNTWQDFIVSVHAHLQDLYSRIAGPVSVTSVSISPATASVVVDNTITLQAIVLPSDATNKSVTWSSNNTTVATVNSVGLVTGKREGNATITVTTVDGGKTASCNITVLPNDIQISVTGVSINPAPITLTAIGETKQLSAVITPSTATNKTVTWSSNNTSVATVTSTGKVTAISQGSATITVTTADGGYTATCLVTVDPQDQDRFYWYIGRESDGVPSSVSNIQTNNTVPGWHEIGTSLSSFNLDTNTNKVILDADLSTPLTNPVLYYIVIPTGLNIYDSDNSQGDYMFNHANCSLSGYKAYKSKGQAYSVKGIIIKQ